MARAQPDVVESIDDLLTHAAGLDGDRWFRGHARFDWEATPKVLRTDVATVLQGREIRRRERLGGMASGDLELLRTRDPGVVLHAERMLNQEFVRRTASLLPGHATLADAYFAAQHYGLPTRLLDWTTQALTALFFAVADNSHDDADGAVLVFNPLHRLYVTLGDSAPVGTVVADANPVSVNHEIVARVIEPIFQRATFQQVVDSAIPSMPEVDTPIAVLPNLTAGRMFAQGSCFTLHPWNCPPFESAVMDKLRVPAGKKADLRRQLRLAGVTLASLFADPDHAVKDLCDEWGL